MADESDLLPLSQRVEEAVGPSRELDCEIGVAIGRAYICCRPYAQDKRLRYGYIDDNGARIVPGELAIPRYTASIDAAMSLVPEGFHLQHLAETRFMRGGPWTVALDDWMERTILHRANARTPALALCAAALRARSSQENG